MHETGLIKNLLAMAEKEIEYDSIAQVAKIIVQLSYWGNIKEAHLRQHFDCFVKNTPWKDVVLEVKEVPCGPPLTLVGVELK